MPLLDRTYFDGPLLLPVADNHAAIDAAIVTYEPICLQAQLGPSGYGAFVAGLAAVSGHHFSTQFSTQFNHGTIADRWKWVRDGHTFTVYGQTYIWPGIRKPLANYVYYHFREETDSRASSSGAQIKSKHENAAVVSPRRPMVLAWNQMADWNAVLRIMLTYLKTGDDPTYPEFNPAELRASEESYNVYNKQIL